MSIIYTDKVGAGPPHPKKRWGLFSKVLSEEEARDRYELDAVRRQAWFGIVLVDDEHDVPVSYLTMSPRANGVALAKLGTYGSIEASYVWGTYYDPADDSVPFEGDVSRVFLGGIRWYSYPDESRYLLRGEAQGNVGITFRENGIAREDTVTNHGFNEPPDVRTREFTGVDLSANWFSIPGFGDWDRFFAPEQAGDLGTPGV